MKEPKFTPGPWRFPRQEGIEETYRTLGRPLLEHDGYFRRNDGDWTVMDRDSEDTRPVALVTFRGQAKRGQGWNAPDAEGIANARLIAAAPDLYKEVERALRNEESRLYMLPASDDEKVSAEKDILSASIGLYRAALAKAVGK